MTRLPRRVEPLGRRGTQRHGDPLVLPPRAVLTVIGPSMTRRFGLPSSLVRCICGAEIVVDNYSLQHGRKLSCGCQRDRMQSETKIKHGHGHARALRSPEYMSWRAMVQRCEWPGHKSFAIYGGRGIVVCSRWRQSFAAFLADMGPRPNGMTLDRYPNVNGNYEPGNCRWATPSEQGRNRRTSTQITFAGETLTLIEWAERIGIKRTTLRERLAAGWEIEEAFTRAVRPHRRAS